MTKKHKLIRQADSILNHSHCKEKLSDSRTASDNNEFSRSRKCKQIDFIKRSYEGVRFQ